MQGEQLGREDLGPPLQISGPIKVIPSLPIILGASASKVYFVSPPLHMSVCYNNERLLHPGAFAHSTFSYICPFWFNDLLFYPVCLVLRPSCRACRGAKRRTLRQCWAAPLASPSSSPSSTGLCPQPSEVKHSFKKTQIRSIV